MGGWADGIITKELGTGDPCDAVWVGFKESVIDMKAGVVFRQTTLSITTPFTEQVWTVLDADAWRQLIAQAEEAIAFLEVAGEAQEDRP